MLKRFIKFYGPHKPLFALDLSMAFVRALCAILIPLVTRHLFKLNEASFHEMAGTVALLVLLVLILAVSAFNNIKWGHVLGTRIETDMRGVLFRHLQKLSFSYFDKTKTGHIMSRLSNDLFTISEVAHHVPEDIFLALVTITGAFICMFWIELHPRTHRADPAPDHGPLRHSFPKALPRHGSRHAQPRRRHQCQHRKFHPRHTGNKILRQRTPRRGPIR